MRIVRIPDDPAPAEPVSLVEAKEALRVTHALEDGFISALIVAGREWAEVETRRSLVPATYELVLDAFPCDLIELPHPPLLEMVELGYRDTDGDWQVFAPAGYDMDAESEPGVVIVDTDSSWPATKSGRSNVRVRYRAGYGDAENPVDIPAGIKTAILVYVAHRYVNREGGDVPDAVRRLLFPHRFDL